MSRTTRVFAPSTKAELKIQRKANAHTSTFSASLLIILPIFVIRSCGCTSRENVCGDANETNDIICMRLVLADVSAYIPCLEIENHCTYSHAAFKTIIDAPPQQPNAMLLAARLSCNRHPSPSIPLEHNLQTGSALRLNTNRKSIDCW